MPELPEVENICNALRPLICGRYFVKAEIFTPKLRTPLTPLPQAPILDKPVSGVRRRGKYMIVDLSGRDALLVHFGMSGSIRVAEDTSKESRRKHEHVILTMDNGKTLRFECPRRFSLFEAIYLPEENGEPAELADLGPEPLSDGFTPEVLFKALQKKKSPVKTAIMDNSVVVGVGNIYAAESLFASGISPLRPANKVTITECQLLHDEIKKILTRAIAGGGSTIRDYRHVDGSIGEFARELAVYGKDGEKCPRCGNALHSVRLGGRSSVYCPECQK